MKNSYWTLLVLLLGVGPLFAAPVTNYPSITGFESDGGPWMNDIAGIDWYRTTYYYDTDTAAYEGDWFACVETWDFNEPANLTAYFDLSNVTDPTISFAYHLLGETSISISLEASLDDGISFDPLWLEIGGHGTNWYATNISLAAYAGETNLMLHFHAMTGYSWESDIALDSIVVQGVVEEGDMDEDGIPNAWETLYFGGPTNANPAANPDSDHYDNLAEYIAGLNPTNSDGLRLSEMHAGPDRIFEWSAVSGRMYKVYWTDDLANEFTMMQSNLVSGVFTDTVHRASSQGYYRLEVEIAP